CQTFDDVLLRQINRRHNAGQVIDAVKVAQDVGFDNISLDFIYGLPNQTIESFLKDLKMAVDLCVQHISLYGLKIEDGCYFYDNMPDNLPDDDEQADMYLGAIQTMKDLKFEHYEVSNFSKKGFNSRHNLTYWNNDEYYGFGVGAHGYVNGVRYGNVETIEEYLNDPLTHKDSHLVLPQEQLEEEIFLGFRKMQGVNVAQINTKYNIDFEEKYNDVLKKYEGLNLITKTPQGYALTEQGILVSNVVLAEFIAD
ncbi:oxygen-independent coproporphyrinogen III oxidase, partial [bacterium]|nr:oxygen-independent coproporphyrinogen III oxidase [bacterium]